MKIALAQMEIIHGDRKENRKKAQQMIEEAAKKECQMILFPEMSLVGLSLRKEKEKNPYLFEKPEVDSTTGFFRECAVKSHIFIGFGWGKPVDEKGENHYSVYDPQGEMIFDYTKIHPFSFGGEDQYFYGGKSLSYFHIEGTSFSAGLCYDLRFPEIFVGMARKATVIFVPANWPAVRKDAWRVLLQARAVENQVTIVGINCVGELSGRKFVGGSIVIDPEGTIIQEGGTKEELVICSLDNNSEAVREKFPVARDRKPDVYLDILKGEE